MTGNDVRDKFLSNMHNTKHVVIPSSPIIPLNDPTTLFTGSGMQPLIPYLMGEKHPMGTRLANSQKCFRAEDIEEVGDNRHTTFFEMLGNWSLGDYFKEEQLRYFFTYLVDHIGLDPQRIYVTVFAGDEALRIPKDTESVAIWKKLFKERGIDATDIYIGSEEDGYSTGMQGGRIFYYDSGKNWWSRAGKPQSMPAGEIGGPDSEVFYDFGSEHATHPLYKDRAAHPNSDSGQFLEIGNSVFIEYLKNADGSFSKLPQRNVDFGGGLERILAAQNNNPDVFMTDLFNLSITQIEELSGKKYSDFTESFRVILDHIRGAVFMISEGVYPSNNEQGYFTRRLIRRSVRHADKLGIPEGALKNIADSVIKTYAQPYPNLIELSPDIVESIHDEEVQFRKTLEQGLKEFNKIALRVSIPTVTDGDSIIIDTKKAPHTEKFISGEQAFILFTTYGFPIELTVEIAKERGMTVALNEFKKCMETHREQSRLGAEDRFKGGLADHGEKTVMYHTITHLLLAGLRKELGEHVHQAGSNITSERLRFDFTHDQKVATDVLMRVETYINEALTKGAHVMVETISKDDAKKDPTIEGSFWDKYPDQVTVYTIADDTGTIYSRELCGGPHVEGTSAITGTFKIIKEESSARGIRRIKGTLI